MFRNYVATALRNLVRNRLYTAINILGLALSLTAALLIALFVRDEFSYDTWIPGHDRVYAVHSTSIERYQTIAYAMAPTITAGLLAKDFPHEIGAIARLSIVGGRSVRRGNIEFPETLGWADPTLFEVLPLPAIAGDPATALQDPNGVVLTRSMARKYFGYDTPIGETLELDRTIVMRVTAVLEDLPSNTHLTNAQFNLGIIASGLNAYARGTPRGADNLVQPTGLIPLLFTYLRLVPGASVDDLRQALPDFERRHLRFQTPVASYTHELMALADLHLHAPPDPRRKQGSAATASGAMAIALLILAIASINFINLTTARATRRAVEVGVRKTSGAERRALMVQFIGESTIYAVLAMALAVVLTELLLPSFNGLLQRTIAFDYLRAPQLLGALFVAIVTIGILAGAYPAFVLSRFSPAAVLKGGRARGLPSGRGRQTLVALQFTVLIVLMLVSTAVYRQTNYVSNEALRFEKDQMLVIRTALGTCDSAFATAVRALPGVRGAACASSQPIPSGGFEKTSIRVKEDTAIMAAQMLTGFDYFDLFGIQPLAGRTFSNDFAGDAGPQDGTAPPSVVINETLSRALGFASPHNAVGQTILWHPVGDFGTAAMAAAFAKKASPDQPSQIVGVVPDFALTTARQAVEPGVFWVGAVGNHFLNVKLQGNQVPEVLAAIDQLWKKVGGPTPIRRNFLDQQIEETYRDVALLSDAMAAFAAVAVFVACLGLFGLATFAAETRTKEIGVRKAMGAGRADILRLMLWEFAKPVLWASPFAWPIAYFIVRAWLEGFVVRIDAGLWTFPAASLLALVIAGITVTGHTLLVTRAKPIAALRYE